MSEPLQGMHLMIFLLFCFCPSKCITQVNKSLFFLNIYYFVRIILALGMIKVQTLDVNRKPADSAGHFRLTWDFIHLNSAAMNS